jgi:hypothetical protein
MTSSFSNYTATFVPATDTLTDAYLQVKCVLADTSTDPTINANFQELIVAVSDSKNTGSDDIYSKKFSRVFVEDNLGDTSFVFKVPLPKVVPASVNIYFTENITGDPDITTVSRTVSLVGESSPPSITVDNVTFSNNSNAVALNGTVKITAAQVADFQKVVLYAHYTPSGQSSGLRFEQSILVSDAAAVSTTTAPYVFTFNLNTLNSTHPLKNVKPDTSVRFHARSVVNDQYSGPSNSVVVNASIRLAAPTISSIKSLQDQKIDISGSMRTQISGAGELFTILAQALPHEESQIDPTLWVQTDQRNIAVQAAASGSSVSNVPFIKTVTKLGNGVDNTQTSLMPGRVYAFIIIKHKGPAQFDSTKSVDIAETGSNKPPADQSAASNMKKGVTITYLSKDLKIASGAQGTAADEPLSLTFAPSVTPSLPSNDLITYAWSFSSVQKKLIKAVRSSSGQAAIPSIFVDLTPVKDDEYTIALKASYYLDDYVIQSIDGTPELQIVDVDNQKSVILADINVKAKKSGDPLSAPVLQNVALHVTSNAGVKKLLVSYESKSVDKSKYTLGDVIIQVTKGTPGSRLALYPNQPGVVDDFVPLYYNSGTMANPVYNSSFNVGFVSGTDVKDSFQFPQLYTQTGTPVNLSANEVYHVRVAGIWNELEFGSAQVTGYWSPLARAEIPPSVMNPASNVSITPVVSSTGSKNFKVIFDIDRDIVDVPSNWGSSPVVTIDSAIVKLLNSDGAQVATKTLSFSSSDAPTGAIAAYEALAANQSLKYSYAGTYFTFNDVPLGAGETVHAQVQIIYRKKDSTLTAFSGKNDVNASGAFRSVSSAITVKSITLLQDPLSLTQTSGNRRADDFDADTTNPSKLTINATVEIGTFAPNSVIVKAILASGNSSTPVEHLLTYNSTDKVYVVNNITRNPNVNYKLTPINVYAYHPDASNVVSVLLVQ